MKDFRELLETKEESKYMSIHHRLFKPIEFENNFSISIQGSYSHYCNPRQTLSIDEYESLEIAIFENDKWIQPHTDKRFLNFSRINELLSHYEESDIAVGGYLPIDLIQDLCEYIENLP